MESPDPTGLTVLITAGEFTGGEGVCLGRVADLWAVSPHDSPRILQLRLPEEFGVVINPRQRLERN
jgi:hypothetical protein